MIPNYKQ